MAVNNPRLSVTEIIPAQVSLLGSDIIIQTIALKVLILKTDILGPVSIAAISNLSHTSSLESTFQLGAWLSLGIQHLLPTTIFKFPKPDFLFYNTINWILDRIHF